MKENKEPFGNDGILAFPNKKIKRTFFIIFILFGLIVGIVIFFNNSRRKEQNPLRSDRNLISNPDYGEYLEQFPNVISSIDQDDFSLAGEVSQMEENFFIAKIEDQEIKIHYSPESQIFHVLTGGSIKKEPFNLVTAETYKGKGLMNFVVKKKDKDLLLIMAIRRASDE